MNPLETALVDVASFLDQRGVPYMVIGGFANLYWGTPRLTEDLDVTVRIEEATWQDFISRLTERFRPLTQSPIEFASRHHVVPVKTDGGIRVDVILESHPIVSRAIDRAVSVDVAGKTIRLCTAEDLILHKLVSERLRDQEDAEGVILRQARSLDRRYLDPLVEQLSRALERPRISTLYQACLKKAGAESS